MKLNPLAVRCFLGVSVLLACGIALTTPFVNEDLFLAFAAGRDVAEGFVAVPDRTSFTAEGRVWVNQAWLSHYLLYLAHEHLGPAGPVGIKVLLFTGCVILILWRCRRLGASPETALTALIPGILASGVFLGLRAENFGLLFFLVFTSLLTADADSKSAHRFAIPLVMVAWSNFHGSFMVGLVLIYIKCLLVTWRAFRKELTSRSDAWEWWVIAAISTIMPGVLSPFGMDNLLMPFKQVGTKAITQYSADWLPLLSFNQLDFGFFGGGSVYPYLILLGLFAISGVIALTAKKAPFLQGIRADLAMEAVIAAVTVMMAFRFRRLVLFSGLSLVPLLSLFLQKAVMKVRDAGLKSAESRGPSAGFGGVAALAASAVCLVLMSALFWRAAVVPYLPGNPFRPERPLMRELMAFDSFPDSLVRFIRTNDIAETNSDERFLAGWELSPYLMYAIPGVKLFMDCRDQSIYPPRVATDFFTILGIIPPRGRDPLDLLDDYGVTCVVMTTGLIDFRAAVKFMQSRRWACVYADTKGLVLVRPDSAKFREAVKSDLKGVWFPDEDSRTLSRALLSHFMFGRIEPEVEDGLKSAAKRDPWPNYYTLITWGMAGVGSCFDRNTVQYLVSEALRLNGTDPARDKAGGQVLESLVRIYGILQENAVQCGEPEIGLRFQKLKNSAQNDYDRLRKSFLGRFL